MAVLLMLAGATACDGGAVSEVSTPASTTGSAGGPAVATAESMAPIVTSSPPVATSAPIVTSAGTVGTTEAPGFEAPVLPDGFSSVAATVTAGDGTQCHVCLWLADSADLRSRGLMSVTDLGDADGMAFVYDAPHTTNFWMKDTLLPLSIAFFGADGRHVGSFDMEPCTADPCPTYPTPADFTVAIETTRGGLADLGIGPGSTLALSDLPCQG